MNSIKQKGFTIIEVVLVLAIAGLIFLAVFIALPALQRSQADGQRDSDLSRAQTAIQSYQQRNRQAIPTASMNWNTVLRDAYLKAGGDTFNDPSGKEYSFTARTDVSAPSGVDATNNGQQTVRIYYTIGAVCADGGTVRAGQGNRKVALRLVLEGGGVACRSN
jgi:prepilin-type N-terminal cleavage/methylation domain-containing protein